MYVKVKLVDSDPLPNRVYGRYDRVSYSEPLEVDPDRLATEEGGLVLTVLPSQKNILVRGVRRREHPDTGELEEFEEILLVGADRADIYLLNDEGKTLEVIWRARWA